MSYRHVKVKKLKETLENIEYKIFSPDFSSNEGWTYLGIINIDVKNNDFSHSDYDLWEKNKIYPLYIFKLEPEERTTIINNQYLDFGNGLFALSVFNFIKECLSKKIFPDEKDIIA